ncbi:uncharacterized protein LOC122640308 [Telopea speciosissima]|uniref:uncharacterized protein LOC122640308 n=1 Tax=Telopea speciosissima TaxID=54955 RepID=UPI001CC7CC0F|nr:uncharacterized protein LOC122640308 [Telopea speciosissima]
MDFRTYSRNYGIYFTLLASLTFQIILTLFGSFRKRYSKIWLTFILWSAYQLSDVAATTGLGIITSYPSDKLDEIVPIWSSFLLLHLGGPDSITALSLIDNELCFRHSIQLLYRVGVAFYIHFKVFLVVKDGEVGRPWFAILVWMLLAGISKYGEKTWVLHSANMSSLRDSMLPPLNSGPILLVPGDDGDHHYPSSRVVVAPEPAAPAPTPGDSGKAILLRGYQYFCSFKCLFVDLKVPSSSIVVEAKEFFSQCDTSFKDAFQVIDVELRFVYDMLFTKALMGRSWLACNLRFLRYSALLYTLIVFFRIGELDMSKKKNWDYDETKFLNSLVAFLFFSWALVQETYEIIQMLLSEWTVVWLNNHKLHRLSMIILNLTLSCRFLVSKLINRCGAGEVAASETTTRNSWWYNNIMSQYNLLSFCFNDEPTMFKRILHLSSWGKSIHEMIQTSWNTTCIDVSNDIKDFIYQQFKERVIQTSDDEEFKSAEFRNPRGKWAMKVNKCSEDLDWSVDVEFDQSILIWHVATDLCYYYDDLESIKRQATPLCHQVEVSKALSHYLLYLLLVLPFMLNDKIGKIRFQDTCAAVKKLFEHMPKDGREKKNKFFCFILGRKKPSLNEKQTQDYIKRMVTSDLEVLRRDTEEDESKSVLLEAHKLAKLLTSFAKEKRWKIISGVWVEMLSYAASNCSGKHHAERLCDNGEFLTKIWLLMAHLGMIEYKFSLPEGRTPQMAPYGEGNLDGTQVGVLCIEAHQYGGGGGGVVSDIDFAVIKVDDWCGRKQAEPKEESGEDQGEGEAQATPTAAALQLRLSDVAATTSLGIVTSFSSYDLDEIAPIWSSFLLLHLGGPDSITAISLVDNDIYFRHSIQLLYRAGVAVYIHFKLFLVRAEKLGGDSWFAVLTWMLLAGISKYGERTWALHSANMANLRNSMLPPPNSGSPIIDLLLAVVPNDHNDDVGDHPHPDQFIPMDEYASGIVAASPTPPPPPPPPGDDGTLLMKGHLDSGSIPLVSDDGDASGVVAGAPATATAMATATTTTASKLTPAPIPPYDGTLLKDQLDHGKAILLRGYQYFCSFKCLFVDLSINVVPSCSSNNVIDTHRFFLQCPCQVAFQLIDVELRFVYDMFFTKALMVRTCLVCNLRFLRYSALLYTLIVLSRSGELDRVENFITSSLVAKLFFSWALIQETYEIIQMLLSEWTVVWLNNHNLNRLSTIILKFILSYRLLGSKLTSICGMGRGVANSETTTTSYTWCFNNIMAQYNLLSFCFKDDQQTIFKTILHLSSWGKSIHEWVAISRNTTSMHVSDNIKDFIYHQFKERVIIQTSESDDEEFKKSETDQFRNPRGKLVMKMMDKCSEHNYLEELGWSIDVEFDESILIWHVATDLCYYSDDLDPNECQAPTFGHQVKVSKALSEYLLYLLLILPFMLNNKIGKIRFQDTSAAVKKLFDHVPKDKREKKSNKLFSFILQRKKKSSLVEKQTKDYIKRFLRLDTQVLMSDTKADGSKSVLLEAHKLAKLLKSFEKEERWKIISGVWVEMLSYAASNCTGKHHAQRLSDGGEFLTKIWLLMAHLGMVE